MACKPMYTPMAAHSAPRCNAHTLRALDADTAASSLDGLSTDTYIYMGTAGLAQRSAGGACGCAARASLVGPRQAGVLHEAAPHTARLVPRAAVAAGPCRGPPRVSSPWAACRSGGPCTL